MAEKDVGIDAKLHLRRIECQEPRTGGAKKSRERHRVTNSRSWGRSTIEVVMQLGRAGGSFIGKN